MRHVRMLGLCVVAALVASAIGAGSALAKDPYSVRHVAAVQTLSVENAGNHRLLHGHTNGGATGGYFQYGTM